MVSIQETDAVINVLISNRWYKILFSGLEPINVIKLKLLYCVYIVRIIFRLSDVINNKNVKYEK